MRLLAFIAIGIVAVVAGLSWANRPQLFRVAGELPDDFPADSFSHASFEALLARYVSGDGYVDYPAWHASTDDSTALDAYLVAVSQWSPESSPERFPTRQDELAYWLYSYNAYVIRGVLDNWPIASVMDVKAPVEVVKGLGFFYRMRYVFGGKAYSLYTLENGIIRKQYRDPRIHFVLNCGSESCPVVRPRLPTGTALEGLLSDSARDFVSNSKNVRVDHDKREVWLSDIFRMYRGDFLNQLRADGQLVDGGLLGYISSVAPEHVRQELDVARDYDIRFRDFDWSVNSSHAL